MTRDVGRPRPLSTAELISAGVRTELLVSMALRWAAGGGVTTSASPPPRRGETSDCSAPASADPVTEINELAALLAEVVELAGKNALLPGRWSQIAELALEHESVRRALQAEETGS